MMPKYFSEMWAAGGPALGDHLWQSTSFALVAGLLTLFLRENHARARYWLWLAASLKFLIPFSLFVAIGKHLAWRFTATNARLYFAVSEVSQPFTQPISLTNPAALSTAASPPQIHLLAFLLTAVWLCGFAMCVSAWYSRWRRIAAAIEEAAPLHEGREVAVLRRMESLGKLRKTIEVLLSPASLEPGIVGIARPILLWPEGISEHLEDMHLEAIVAHEVWHVKRWDNLAAAVHLTVEALFWFHPLVWWLGGRLLDERERACDEAVLEIGSERLIYAESILRTCEFCVQSRLACASGVAGGDLKKRIAHIMAQPVACSLELRKKLLLGAAGLAAIAMPLMLGLLNITPVRAGPLAKNPAGGGRMSEVPYAIHDLPAATPFVSKVRSSKAKVCLKSARVHKPDLSVKTDAGREH